MATETWNDTVARSPEAVLEHLRAEAEHKAALRMYFSAAELLRAYSGVFADETRLERERLAAEYEQAGTQAEQERKQHGDILHDHLPLPSPPPPAIMAWHCPACHTAFPEGLVVCGKCGFDLRTGKPYQAPVPTPPKPAPPPHHEPVVPLAPRRGRHRHHSQQEFTALWIIAAVLVVLFIVLGILGATKKKQMPVIEIKPSQGTWQW
jgi:predicted nucleic acid-binding Zn ribbon protein